MGRRTGSLLLLLKDGRLGFYKTKWTCTLLFPLSFCLPFNFLTVIVPVIDVAFRCRMFSRLMLFVNLSVIQGLLNYTNPADV
jgi:hypothetical protein